MREQRIEEDLPGRRNRISSYGKTGRDWTRRIKCEEGGRRREIWGRTINSICFLKIGFLLNFDISSHITKLGHFKSLQMFLKPFTLIKL